MKILQNFDDYALDLLVEAITQKEIPLIFSDRFKALISKINHPISRRLLRAESNTENQKNSFIDTDDSGVDKVSFITSTKAAEVVADYKGMDKTGDRDIEFSRSTFTDLKYDQRLRDSMYLKYRSVTSIGKLINKLFPKEFEAGGKPGEDIQSFVDKFKSIRDNKDLEIVEGHNIVKYYNVKKYVDGEDTGGNLGSSCMRDEECGDYIQFYADNSSVVSLLILRDIDKPKKIRGRALVWKLSSPKGRIFMDRIYTVDSYDEEIFKNYAKDKGWLYKFRQNSSDGEYIIDTKDDSKEFMTLTVKDVKNSSTNKYPYVDTVKYYYPDDGILSTDDDMGSEKWTLEDTGGGYEEDDGIYVEFYDRSYPENDLTYCEMGDEYRLEDDAVYIDFYGQSATEEYIEKNMVQCDYSNNRGDYSDYRETRDTVDVYGSDEVACLDYAQNNMIYSEYHDGYLPEGDDVWSEHHESSLYEPEAVEVYLDAAQRKTDWRAEDDDTWWEWEHDGEKYDEDVTEKELREYNDLDEEDEK